MSIVDYVKNYLKEGKQSKHINEGSDEKTTLLNVEKAVAKVGHDTKTVKATDKDYAGLHSCCLYERE